MKTLRSLILLLLVACGGPLKYNVASSPKAPGADAKIVADVKKDQNQTLLEVDIQNLAPPSRVSEGTKHYVAWYRKNDSTQWMRLASVKYDEDSRKGKLSASAPETSFDFEVSAEKEDGPASPSSEIIFSQRVGE